MRVLKLTAAGVLAAVLSGPALAAPVCLRVIDIASTQSPDGRVLVVTTWDGKVWQNRLRGKCPGLKFDGFAWVIRGGEICDNSQTLQVLHTRQICQLGSFTLQSKPSAGAGKP
jgi:hypothetical protein